MSTSLCLLCRRPDEVWLEFLNTFVGYEVFVVIDDNTWDQHEQMVSRYPRLQLIQIDNRDCEQWGFVDGNFLNSRITAWEKSWYYFSVLNRHHDHVWFLEDDVFVCQEATIQQIDEQYPASDILCASCSVNREGAYTDWHWNQIRINFPPPYYWAMVCAVRMSRALLNAVRDYAEQNRTLFFLEALLPSLAKKQKLKYDTPPELRNIVYRHEWQLADIEKQSLYHPIKDLAQQAEFRRRL